MLFSFNGRVTRRAYWLGRAGLFAVAMLGNLLGPMERGLKGLDASPSPSTLTGLLILPLSFLIILGVAWWISFSLTVRRWHDRGKSGTWALLGFVPLIGWVWQAIECGRLEGTLGPNRFGPSPKGIVSVTYTDGRTVPAGFSDLART